MIVNAVIKQIHERKGNTYYLKEVNMNDDVCCSPHCLCAVRAAPQEPDEPQGRAFLSAVLTACHVEMERFLIHQVFNLLSSLLLANSI